MAGSNAEQAIDRVESEITERTDRESVSTAMRYARRVAGSGSLTGVSGSVTLLRGIRALRRGDRRRGLVRLLLGGLFVAIAVLQRRSTGGDGVGSPGSSVDQTDVADTTPDFGDVDTESEDEDDPERKASGDEAAEVADTSPDVGKIETETGEEADRDADEAAAVVDTSPDFESVDTESEDDPEREASGDEAAEVADTSPDVGEIETETRDGSDGSETEEPETSAGDDSGAESGEGEPEGPGGDETTADDETAAADASPGAESVETGTGEETYERLGEAAFDEHGREVPVPQRAFDLNILTLGDEAFWGVRETDDAVIVSGLYDPIQEGEGVRYVASSQIDEERMLQVPDAVTNHWDEIAGGGTAVASGDGLVFAITDDAEAEGQLLVVPDQWTDEFPGLGEGE